MRYACEIWKQIQSNGFNITQRSQNEALGVISFKQFMEPSQYLYNQLKINSLKNNIIL